MLDNISAIVDSAKSSFTGADDGTGFTDWFPNYPPPTHTHWKMIKKLIDLYLKFSRHVTYLVKPYT